MSKAVRPLWPLESDPFSLAPTNGVADISQRGTVSLLGARGILKKHSITLRVELFYCHETPPPHLVAALMSQSPNKSAY